MLIASVLSDETLKIRITGSHGMSYVKMTTDIMSDFGVKAEFDPSKNEYLIHPGQNYVPGEYNIEPDVSAAAYFYALTPLLGIQTCVKGIHFTSVQGDIEFIHALEKMGCTSFDSDDGIILYPPDDGMIKGIDIDMSSFSDQAITLAVIASFADTPTHITGIGHIRKQESDRISAIVTELNKMGIKAAETENSITIIPGDHIPSCVDTYNDHRMAMGFTLAGLKSPGIVINDPGCCEKTFENYYLVLEDIISKISS